MNEKSKEEFSLSTINDIVTVEFTYLEDQVYDFIRLRSKKQNSKNKLSNNFIDTYILFLVYQFYKKRNNFIAKDAIYQEDTVVLEISPGNDKYSKIKITSGKNLKIPVFIRSESKILLIDFRAIKTYY